MSIFDKKNYGSILPTLTVTTCTIYSRCKKWQEQPNSASITEFHAEFARGCCLSLFMAALWNRAGHYIFALWFFLSSFLFFLFFLT